MAEAQAQIVQLQQEAEDAEKKLQIWKGRAKQKIQELEEQIEGLEEKAARADEVESRFEIFKEKARSKIKAMEEEAATSATATAPPNNSDALLEEANTRLQSYKMQAKQRLGDLEAQLSAKEASESAAVAKISEVQNEAAKQIAVLEAKVKAFEETASSAANSTTEVEAKLAENANRLQTFKERAKAKISDLEENLSTTEQRALHAEKELTELKLSFESKITSLSTTQQHSDELQAKLEQAETQAARLESFKDKATAKLKALDTKLTDSVSRAEKSETELNTATESLLEVQDQLASSTAKTAALEAKVSSLEAASSEQNTTTDSKVLSLQADLTAADDRTSEVTERLEAFKEKAKAKISSLEQKHETAITAERSEVSRLTAAWESLEEELKGARKEVSRLEGDLAEAGETAEGSEVMQREVAKQQEVIDTMREDAAVAKKRLEEKGVEAKRLEGEIASLKSKVEDLAFLEDMQESKPTHSDEEYTALSKTCTTLKKRVAALEGEAEVLTAAAEKKNEEIRALEEAGEDVKQKYVLFRQRAKELREREAQEAEDRLQDLHNACDTEREKVRSADTLVMELRQRCDTFEQQTTELERECSQLGLQAEEAEHALQEARERAEGQLEEMSVLDSKYQLRMDHALEEADSKHQLAMADLTAEWTSKQTDTKAQHDSEALQRVTSLEDRLDQARKELKTAREQVSKAAEEKEREAIIQGRATSELKKRIHDLEGQADLSSSTLGRSLQRESSSPSFAQADSEKFGNPDFGRDMMYLAQQQANRDFELQALKTDNHTLTKKVAEVTKQRDNNMERLNELSKGQNEQRASESRGKVNMDYLKNILVKFIAEKNRDVQSNLVPVIATMLELSNEEKGVLKKEFPSARIM